MPKLKSPLTLFVPTLIVMALLAMPGLWQYFLGARRLAARLAFDVVAIEAWHALTIHSAYAGL